MKNLFKYASEHWKALLAIVAILIVQAYCDLSLPAYTSDIVNVGIQQGGVEDHIPDAISAEDMETLLLFASEKDGKTVLSAYEKDDKTYEEQAYVLKDTVKEDTDRTEKLSGILAAPMMMAVSGTFMLMPKVRSFLTNFFSDTYSSSFNFLVQATARAPGPIWHPMLRDRGAPNTGTPGYNSLTVSSSSWAACSLHVWAICR